MPNDRPDVTTLAARLDAVERTLTDETRTAPRSAAEPGPAPAALELTASPDSSAASDAPDAASGRPDENPADGDAVRRLERRVEELTAELAFEASPAWSGPAPGPRCDTPTGRCPRE